jgi:putative ABC transport system permease protein
MWRNYLKIAFRNLWKHKIYSLINVLGLSVGLACCILIALFILDELSYDRYHSKSERIYRLTRDFMDDDGKASLHLGHVAPPFGHLLKDEFPNEIEHLARTLQNESLFRFGEKAFYETNTFFAEKDLFKIFDIKVLSGNSDKALQEPFSVLLSQKIAQKYFGKEDPMGKILTATSRQISVKVSGVYQDFPRNSHFHPEVLISFNTLNDSTLYGRRQLQTNWGNNSFGTYLSLKKGYPADKLQARFPHFIDKYFGPYALENYGVPKDFKASNKTHLYLQKVTDIHLLSHLDSETETNGSMTAVYVFAVVGLFILLIAAINFVNLSTARSANRAKEVGIRKVAGAIKNDLIIQFLGESILITFISMVLAVGLVELGLPLLNEMSGKPFTTHYFGENWYLLPTLLVLAILIGALAGFYPAIYLSSFNPVRVLKGQLSSGSRNSILRTSLVVVQFSISIVLIICTMIVFQQLSYMLNKDLGLNKENMAILRFPPELGPNYEAFRQELTKNTLIKSVALSQNLPANRLLNSCGAKVQLGDSLVSPSQTIKFEQVNEDYLTTYQIKFAAGRNFSRAYKTDTAAYILNEAAIKMIGFKSPQEAVNQPFEYCQRRGKIIGITKDFHHEALHEPIVPLVFFIPSQNTSYNAVSVKVDAKNTTASLAYLKEVWLKFAPKEPFEPRFLDQNFQEVYNREQKLSKIFFSFAGIAIFIACLGLYGLTTYTIEQRTKEIGIRKVLGASVNDILILVNKDFTRLVLIAMGLAFPLAWYMMSQWLQDFAYRVNISLLVFLISGVIALVIAILTISFQAFKAVSVNPVEVLKNE